MEPRKITEETLAAFARQLGEEERSPATLEKYLREVRQFAAFLGGREVTRELAAAWREELSARQSPATVNGKLTALDRLLAFLGWEDCRVKHLRVQRQLFRDSARELSREEYARLVETARRLGRGRLSLLMETICATGIRVSEVRYITAEAVREGRTEIALKGKIRTILLPGKLCRKLEKYARQKKNHLRRTVPHQKRQAHVPEADLGRDEGGVPGGRGRSVQGLSPQPAPPVCPVFLPGEPGCGKAG